MTKKAAVLGYPISHSLSPKLHGYWIKQYGLDASYEAIEVKPENVKETFNRLKDEGYVGWNVTVPHKEEALKLVDEADDIAKAIGAVNMVMVKEGKLIGYNTDAFGFLQNVMISTNKPFNQGAPFAGEKALVIGAGGAARAVISAIKSAGINQIYITNRTQEKAEKLIENFRDKDAFKIIPWEEKDAALEGVDFLINTTSLGMQNQPPLAINLDKLPKTAIVNDIVYKPLETELLKAARKRGNIVVDGIGMLIWQAVPAFNAWFAKEPEVTQTLKDYMVKLSQA